MLKVDATCRQDGLATLFVAIALWFVSFVVLLGVSIITWSFRNGVVGGPDPMIIESHGTLALGR